MVIRASGGNVWLTLNGKPLSFEDNEDQIVDAVENHKNILLITPQAPDDIRISVDNEEIETYRHGRWDWYPKDYAGLYTLEISAPGYPLFAVKVRVLPGKLSQARYETMLVEISEIATDLLFSVNSPASARAKAQFREYQPSPLRDYHLIQPIVYKLKDIMLQIRRNPLRILQRYSEQRLLHEVYEFSGEAAPIEGALIALPEKVASDCGVKYLPEVWKVQRSVLTYDVYENRLLKHFLQHQLINRLSTIQDRAMLEVRRREQDRKKKLKNNWRDDETEKIEELEIVVEECQKMGKWCIAWGSEAFLTSVKPLAMFGKATQVLLKNPYYNRFYHHYLDFQRELKISLNTEQYVTTLALRKMSELYEMWSVFQITRIILNKLMAHNYVVTSNSLFFELERDHFQFEVKKNVASVVLTQDAVRVEIKYEPLYPQFIEGMKGLVSVDYKQLTPDMAIEIFKQNQVQGIIVFDAKYRYQKVDDGSYHPLDENLDKMRKYRDQIRYKAYNPMNPRQKPYKVVTSAYIIYPGNYLEHDRDEPEVGALPLIPAMERDDRLDIEDAIEDILWFARLV